MFNLIKRMQEKKQARANAEAEARAKAEAEAKARAEAEWEMMEAYENYIRENGLPRLAPKN